MNVQEEIKKLQDQLDALKSLVDFPLETENIIRERLNLSFLPVITVSSKTIASGRQSVDEGGISTYNVMKPPTGFLSVAYNGVNYDIPTL